MAKLEVIRPYASKGKQYQVGDIIECKEPEATLLLRQRLVIRSIEVAKQEPEAEVAKPKRTKKR